MSVVIVTHICYRNFECLASKVSVELIKTESSIFGSICGLSITFSWLLSSAQIRFDNIYVLIEIAYCNANL